MNGEKLFKSMNNINQEWIEQAKPPGIRSFMVKS